MSRTYGQNGQDKQDSSLPILGKAARTTNEVILSDVDKNFDFPLRMFATFPTADSKLNFSAQQVEKADLSGQSTPAISSQVPTFPASTVDFQTGATTGGTFDLTLPASTVGQFRRIGFSLLADNTMKALISDEAASVGALPNPGTLFVKSAKQCGWIDLECTGAGGEFKTAGSATNIIENKVGSAATIVNFGSGGGGGSGSGDSNTLMSDYADLLDAIPYELLAANIFALDADTKTNTGNTTATFDLVNDGYNFANIGDIHESLPLIPDAFALEVANISKAFIKIDYDVANVDPAPTVEISKDDGVSFQTATLNRLASTGAFEGEINFAEPTPTAVYEQATNNQSFAMGGSYDKVAQIFTATKNTVVRSIDLTFGTTASAIGVLTISIVKAATGVTLALEPIGEILASASIVPSALDSSTYTFNLNCYLDKDETYFILVSGDSTFFNDAATAEIQYNDSYVGSEEMILHNESTGIWSVETGGIMTFSVDGWLSQIITKITSSVAGPLLKGIGVFYQPTDAYSNTSINKFERFFVNTNDNAAAVTEFTVAKFLPDPYLVEIFVLETGQVFRHPTFQIDGYKVTFPVGFFYDGQGSTLTVVVDQNRGCSIDASDRNAALMAANHLGSTDSSIDLSQPARGPVVQRPDGVKVEITVDNDNNIVIYSV